MEYMSSGLENSAATSRKMWMLSASSRARWVSLATPARAAAARNGFQSVVTGLLSWACIETFPGSIKSRRRAGIAKCGGLY